MWFRCLAAALVLVWSIAPAAADEPPALARARALYNAGSYDAAIEAATAARVQPAFADAAALVLARAHLERFRQTATAADLATARDTFGSVRAGALAPRDQADLLIGLGQTLYLDERFGAAAELFETALARASVLEAGDRLRLLDWWASALDREAQTRPSERRGPLFARIEGRMSEELQRDPASPVANYWLPVAARGRGDLDGAWDAAVAAWVRSTLAPDTTPTLRGDLDRLVTQALIPERVRTRPAREQADALATLRAEWDEVKQHWK